MSGDEYKTCPYCGEEIKLVAIKCKHCQSFLHKDVDSEMKYIKKEEQPMLSVDNKLSKVSIWKKWWVWASLTLLLAGFIILFWQKGSEADIVPSVEPHEIVELEMEEWVEASNFVTSKVNGLTGIYETALWIDVKNEEELRELRIIIQEARNMEPPYLFRDMYPAFLEGIDLLEKGANAYENEEDNFNYILSYLEGLNIMNKARFVMWERVVELKPFD